MHLVGLNVPIPPPGGGVNCAANDTLNTNNTNNPQNICGVPVPWVDVNVAGTGGIRVYSLAALTVGGGTLTLRGTRAVLLVVHGDVDISADINAGAAGNQNGAGASLEPTCVGADGHVENSNGGGGGGGGNRTSGAEGGRVFAGIATLGGQALPPGVLQGGCSGGRGGKDRQDNAALAQGGGGGGAVQITALGRISVSGRILAGGGGGAAGAASADGGGGGGGSGGLVVLEAPTVETSGTQVVTGGGGGKEATPGTDGNLGGAGAPPPLGGGTGGTLTTLPTVGTNTAENGNTGGGGGGGASGLTTLCQGTPIVCN